MKLDFNNRMTITKGGVLPLSGSLKKMKIVKSIKEKVDFTEDERLLLNLQQLDNGSIRYQSTRPLDEFTINVDFSTDELDLLKEGASRLDQSEQVTEDLIGTIEMLLLG